MNKTIRLSLILLFSCLPAMAQATIWYVNLNATGVQNGSSWADAFVSPQQGLNAAKSGDEVWVAKGSYYVYEIPIAIPFKLKSGVRLLGGFNGNETNKAQRDWILNATELYTLTWHLLVCDDTGPGTLLDGFILKGGRVYKVNPETSQLDCGPPDQPQFNCWGGGLFVYNTDSTTTIHLDIRNCIFKNNFANEGGAIAIDLFYGGGNINIENCQFVENQAQAIGGAVRIGTGNFGNINISIKNCLFKQNLIYNTIGGAPGMYIQNFSQTAQFEFYNLIFQNNKTTTWAGALGVESFSPKKIKFDDCTFLNNEAGLLQFVPGRGGAIAGSAFEFHNSKFIGNKSRRGGAVLAEADFYNCYFEGNYAEKDGGAIEFSNSMKVVNCTFVNNFAKGHGGAIYTDGGDSRDTIINSIFFNNQTQTDKNNNVELGVFAEYLFVKNCAFPFSNCDSIWLNGGYSTNPGVECHNNLYNLNPVFRDTANGDYRLAPCSPLRNQGDSAAVARYGLLHDLAGLPRVLNGMPDIGAYETPALEASYTQFPITCHNANDGILQFQALGGFGPFGFSWSDNAGTLNREYLAPGQYHLSVSDINNCKDTLEFTFDNPPPFFVTAEKQDVDAIGASNGWAAISQIAGGEAPYTVTWDNGDTTLHLENLPAGEYTVYVRDHRGCDTILTLVVGTTVADNNPQNEAIAAFFVPSPCKTCILQPLRQGPDALEIPVSLYDLNGRLLYQYRGFIGSALPLPTQPPGLYVLRAGRQVLRYVQE